MKWARFMDLICALAVIWGFLALVPVHKVWFAPGEVIVSDTDVHTPPGITFDRRIRRDVKMTYQVVVRSHPGGEVICDPSAGPFTYRKAAQLPEKIDLVWWSGADTRCWPRDPGTYTMETCWTVVEPFWGIVPPKTICRRSNPFRVSAVSPDVAEEVIEKQQILERQIQSLERGLRAVQK